MVWDKGLGEALHSAPNFAKPHGTPGGQEDTEVLSREYSAHGYAGRQGQARTQTQNAHSGLSQQWVRIGWQLARGRDYS